jgi:hypothetical protein
MSIVLRRLARWHLMIASYQLHLGPALLPFVAQSSDPPKVWEVALVISSSRFSLQHQRTLQYIHDGRARSHTYTFEPRRRFSDIHT